MIVLSVLAGIVNVLLITLAPRYVVAVLHSDPTNTAYVFAPGALGVLLALGAGPALIYRIGERATALVALSTAALALFLLGSVEQVGAVLDFANPLRAAAWVGIEMNGDMRTAGLLAVPLSFGVSLTATSVQTYVNRRVPIPYQGRTFAIQSALRNGAAIGPLLTMGAAAAVIGADGVLLISPLVLLVVGYSLVYASFRISGLRRPKELDVLESFWGEPSRDAATRSSSSRRK
jgi:hypothetical protein